jgi:glucosamine-6-phosphate deaminase
MSHSTLHPLKEREHQPNGALLSGQVTPRDLYAWCKVPYQELENHPERKTPFRLCRDSEAMGDLMARELVEEIKVHNQRGEPTRAIIPCGPICWYAPFTRLVNADGVSLKNFEVFHMDECLDWQGRELPRNHPFNFRRYMEENFYAPIAPELAVPLANRYWLNGNNVEAIKTKIESVMIDVCYGGWGQDGHLAYNQARRHPYSHLTLDDLRHSTVRIQENNFDTILALSERNLGTAYQFIPPMSVTLGLKEVLSAKRVRVFSDTGAWKQTALRIALFGPLTVEYPITLLQTHPDALITATVATARHPISEHPEWDFGLE